MSLAVRLARYAPAYAEAQAAGLGFLGEEERSRRDSFKASARREQFVAARWLARQMLMALRGGAPADWELSAIAHTPPRVLRGPDTNLLVGLSHSSDWIACAVASFPVGIDLETVTRPRKVAPLARQACSDEEQAELATLPAEQQLQQFYRMWTQKEAWLKQRGLGLDFSLMRGLAALPSAAAQANALSLFDADAGLRLALTAEQLPAAITVEGAAFGERAWWRLEQRAS
ncbi:MAG TPA: 4'-phosphopantetheinyl transferase superfamily protein [Solimonas sp.]|nr:4'-phosphopantetheinyl transferase superfamily protein [Solimonas sp.]